MASAMGFFDRFRPSSDKTALAQLAELAGRKEALIERLARHAAMCPYGTIRTGLERIAAQQSEGFQVLRSLLAQRQMWPRPPESRPHEGSNNWERLNHDLAMLGTVVSEIERASRVWEGIDSATAEKLLAVAIADGEAQTQLRALALKCDPQALD
jgi:hypothetical protein